MNRTTPHLRVRSAAWVLAVALAFGGIAAAGPAVLCVGDDGHTDVEYSLAGCCILVVEEAEHTSSAAKIAGRSGCDDCVDLGLNQDSLIAGKKLLPAPEATVLRWALSLSETASAKTAAVFQRTVHEWLTAVLSSTVLLI